MPPLPKAANRRQRRNRTTTAATLAAEPLEVIPELPKRKRKWHGFTLAWWATVQSSPMRAEYLESDLHGLYMLADLVDQYWRASDEQCPTASLAAEIRQQGQRFGLSPIDRRRLQWEVARVEEAEGKRAPAQQAPKRRAAVDPREALRIVS